MELSDKSFVLLPHSISCLFSRFNENYFHHQLCVECHFIRDGRCWKYIHPLGVNQMLFLSSPSLKSSSIQLSTVRSRRWSARATTLRHVQSRRNKRQLSPVLYRWSRIPFVCQCVFSCFLSNSNSHRIGQTLSFAFAEELQRDDFPEARQHCVAAVVVVYNPMGVHMVQ